MSEHHFSRGLIDRSGYEAEGFAESYDRFRPAPPAELLTLLMTVAQTQRPRLVVDLGAGPGLSTRVWASRAAEVIGVEPNPRMLQQARSGLRRGTCAASRGGLTEPACPVAARTW